MGKFIIECKSCGAQFECEEGVRTATCSYCGTLNTISKTMDVNANIYNRANYLRRSNEFDRAIEAYEQILQIDNTEYEAHFGIVLCKYGIEFVEDPGTHERIPTCHRAHYESIFADSSYKSALEYAPEEIKRAYQDQAAVIDRIQKGILALAEKQEKYDVFICYKETEEDERTEDSVIAQELYFELTKRGYHVFFARKTLEGKLGSSYEPVIFAALNSSNVMVVLGCSPQNFNAVWVKNEWSRFRERIKKGEKVTLIPAYKNMSPYELPPEFSHLQALNVSKIGFLQDLCDAVDKLIRGTKDSSCHPVSSQYDGLIKRAFLFMEDGNFATANEYLEKALDQNPEDARAYIGKLMIELNIKEESLLANHETPLHYNANFRKALRFATTSQKAVYEKYDQTIMDRIERIKAEKRQKEEEERIRREKEAEQARIEYERRQEQARLELAARRKSTRKAWLITGPILAGFVIFAILLFTTLIPQQKYDNAVQMASEGKYGQAAAAFAKIMDYKDSSGLYKKAVYNQAFQESENGNYEKAGNILLTVLDMNGASEQLQKVAGKIYRQGDADLALDFYMPIADREDVVTALYGIASDSYNKGDFGMAYKAWRIAKDYAYNNVALAIVSTGQKHTVGFAAGGSVGAAGNNDYGQMDVSEWTNILQVSAGTSHTVGLRTDHTVVATGYDEYGQCDTEDWEDITLVSAGSFHTVGLKADGTVVATGLDDAGQCDVSEWTDIVEVSAGNGFTLGLRSDGIVLAAGDNTYGQCDVLKWTDIIAVSAGDRHTVGLKADGTVVAAGDNSKGQCNVQGAKNIAAVDAGWGHTLMLKSDGSVVAVGDNSSGQCDVSGWSDIVAFSAGFDSSIGVQSNGQVMYTATLLNGNYLKVDPSGWDLL